METDGDEVQAASEMSTWLNATGQVESTIPASLADALDLTAGDEVTVTPVVADGELAFRVALGNASGTHVVKVKRRVEPHTQTTLRIPAPLAAVSGLTGHVRERNVSLAYERRADGFEVRPWPPLRPWAPVGRDPLDLDAADREIVPMPEQYMLTVPVEYARALHLEGGQPVAWHLAVRDGALALVVDLDIERGDDGCIRRVQHHHAGGSGRKIDQYHLYPPKGVIDALGWLKTPLTITGGEGYLQLRRRD